MKNNDEKMVKIQNETLKNEIQKNEIEKRVPSEMKNIVIKNLKKI